MGKWRGRGTFPQKGSPSKLPERLAPPFPLPKAFALIESLFAVFPGTEEGKAPFTITV